MRKIKFRGWDEGKMFYYNSWFTLSRQEVLCFEEPEEHSYVDDSDVDYPSHVHLMQFTGLLDKNGKEIYEGDIVEHQNRDGTAKKISVVNWEYDGWNYNAWDDNRWDEIEIKGNLFENRELVPNISNTWAIDDLST